MKLEATESYWFNLLGDVRRVVDAEYQAGESLPIHIHFVYNAKRDQQTDEELQAQFGQWPSVNTSLPTSHNFLGNVCKQYENQNIRCFWKEGCSMTESMDLMLRADLIYISGSSFSQTLSLFHPYAIKLYAVAKELNWHGVAGEIPFLSTHASALSSPEYYYIHVDGLIYSEQFAYMNLEERSSRRRRLLSAGVSS
uniref:Uncharacterized protein n=1 Tax=Grammatophora oceanica TaxID=210454 RepID=A0A7S1YMZ2_9STRA|mmetsp:Transcript_738/g.1036  ORF Transcript_738/g.1036 Transcript_738/m.1036 type:complete len:196 (+) Transcript_738:1-588(+)